MPMDYRPFMRGNQMDMPPNQQGGFGRGFQTFGYDPNAAGGAMSSVMNPTWQAPPTPNGVWNWMSTGQRSPGPGGAGGGGPLARQQPSPNDPWYGRPAGQGSYAGPGGEGSGDIPWIPSNRPPMLTQPPHMMLPPHQAQPAMQNGPPRMFKRGGSVPNRAFGGFNMAKAPHLGPTPTMRSEMHGMTRGPILSTVPGRTDAHFTHVSSGSYVVPADIVSGRGQGNTLAGMNVLQKLFSMGPYGSPAGRITRGPGAPRAMMPKAPKFHSGGGKGGDDRHEGKPVRVNLAGGELVIPPENLRKTVHPDLKMAHEIMDRWVVEERKRLRKTLAKLPGPVKS